MKKEILFSIAAMVLAISTLSEAYTSPIEGGATVVVQDVWNLSTNLYVGKSSNLNTLIVTNGGSVSNPYWGDIGFDSSANYNAAVVTGPSSRWTCYGLRIGADGSNNSVEVLDGAWLDGAGGYYSILGLDSLTHDNTMLVDGVGSLWSAYLIYVGYAGSENEIVISGGGKILSYRSLVMGAWASGHYNTVTAQGAGTLLEIADDIFMGINWWDWNADGTKTPMGTHNHLTVKDGAQCIAGGTILNWNLSTLEIGEGSEVSAAAYEMNSTSDLIVKCAQYPTDCGKLSVSGGITVSGDLIVTKDLGTTIGTGFIMDLMDGTITGTFSSVTLPALTHPLAWDTSLLYSDGIIFTPGLADADADGISDPWEVTHFGTIAACIATEDSDGDGHDNYSEYVAGTLPRVKASCLNVTMEMVGGSRVFTWDPQAGRTYSLLWTTDLLTPFNELHGGIVPPQNSASDASPLTDTRFYRIGVEMD